MQTFADSTQLFYSASSRISLASDTPKVEPSSRYVRRLLWLDGADAIPAGDEGALAECALRNQYTDVVIPVTLLSRFQEIADCPQVLPLIQEASTQPLINGDAAALMQAVEGCSAQKGIVYTSRINSSEIEREPSLRDLTQMELAEREVQLLLSVMAPGQQLFWRLTSSTAYEMKRMTEWLPRFIRRYRQRVTVVLTPLTESASGTHVHPLLRRLDPSADAIVLLLSASSEEGSLTALPAVKSVDRVLCFDEGRRLSGVAVPYGDSQSDQERVRLLGRWLSGAEHIDAFGQS